MKGYKLRLLASGYTQRSGVDFFEAFSPVVSFDAIHTVLSVSVLNGWNIKALDFKQTFLNASRSEIWLELPSGKVVQTCKAVNSLRQSDLEWFKEPRKSIVDTRWESSAQVYEGGC